MKYYSLLFVCLILSGGVSHATEQSLTSLTDEDRSYSQILTVQAGPIQPTALNISNGNYSYQYSPQLTQATLAEVGWSARLAQFHWLGSFYVSENLALTQFQGAASSSISGGGSGVDNLSLNMVGIDSRLVYSMDWFPVKWVIPFIEGGYQISYYSQTGNNDLESVQGSFGNFVEGAGLKIWINKAWSDSSLPIFATIKWNKNLASSTNISFENDSYLIGLGIGL